MARYRVHEEVTAPIWDEPAPPPYPYGYAPDELTSGMRPRPMAIAAEVPAERSILPAWLDEALRDPAIVVAIACALGLAATALAGIVGFLLGLLVG